MRADSVAAEAEASGVAASMAAAFTVAGRADSAVGPVAIAGAWPAIAAAGRTQKNQLTGAIAALQSVGAPISGVVLTMLHTTGPDAYGYGRYGYGRYGYRPGYGLAAAGVGAAAAAGYYGSTYGGCGRYAFYDQYSGTCRPY